ncbi:hypothetical protein Sjap_024235 [Stephania japonica]|uniref:Stress-induced protein KIN2-like n=1 Tax=Stephania japonica TaxID=461633 RepID=A0AAP0EKB0_9MAGN
MSSDKCQDMSFQAGEAKGQAEVKKDALMDKASNAAQSAKESCQKAGETVKAKAQDAADAVKNATGMNK